MQKSIGLGFSLFNKKIGINKKGFSQNISAKAFLKSIIIRLHLKMEAIEKGV
ncbi:hypothetical protein [Flavobacterium psychrophilum]|uniref:hypothetical protein n=1 Tax=Flavobacterium psychrophilum TaxID=96345 RepID=UPI00141BE79B|nr:hypothetical protein [Flavobacterium psychrophilum]MBF2024854.1 hypothetical protein [Flavobacterium psychrophilum]MCB5984487.1 hypothetical protein [Flavobacterium psychrophilum]MCB5995513.1 hypothetical protein [Flavobacterium psychrophilum]MCB5997904.1 hypothetical protein [Flavobacterium psychrophilum]MCB6005415.1 hypothetical protein [Flavobacterium psychrophilum]